MKRIFFLLAIVVTLGISAQSCREMGIDPWDKDKGNGGGDKTDTTTLPIAKLVGTKWQLVSIVRSTQNGSQTETQIIPKEQFISLAFDTPNHVSGSNLCNAYGGTVTSTSTGVIKFTDIFSTEAYCGDGMPDTEYMIGLNGSTTYFASEKELRINYNHQVSIPENSGNTLVFAPLTGSSNGGEIDIRVQQMAGRSYTLYSFVNGGAEDVLTDAQNCKIAFMPDSKGTGTANIIADCNKGTADLSFNADYDAMKLNNITLTKIACQNQMTADRFVEFLRNTGHFEYSDYGTTLTIWSSLTTFAESKMVLKVAQDPDPLPSDTIQIQETPVTGVPANTYPMFYLTNLVFDGTSINISYKYGGSTDDYRISAYSLFEFNESNPSKMFVDLVTDGGSNPFSNMTQGETTISLDAIRSRILTASPNKTKILLRFRWDGKEIAQANITV